VFKLSLAALPLPYSLGHFFFILCYLSLYFLFSHPQAANILKPALARGEVQCIGATTLDEYRKHIERDPALERRFQPVQVRAFYSRVDSA
jgi:hypothetical protein